MNERKSGPLKLLPLALFVLVAALALAACGSSGGGSSSTSSTESSESDSSESQESDSGSGEFAAIEAEVEELREQPTEIPITTPFEGDFPKGKKIDYLQCAAPACVEIGEQLTEAAEAVGWNLKVINEGATPEEVKAAWELVVEEEPDGVVPTGGYPRQIYRQQLAQLKAAEIPVIGHSEAVPANPEEAFVSVIGGPELDAQIGKQEANWIIAETGGEANVLFINSGYPINTLQEEAMVAQLEAECPETCTSNSYQAPISSIGKDLAGKIAAQLQSHPDTNYLIPAFGDMAVGIPAALAGAGVEPVPTITQTPGDANIADIESGAINAAWAPVGPVGSWSIIDTFGRLFTEQSFPEEIPAIEWWITAETLPSNDEPFAGVEDYKEQFETLWNLK